MMRITALPITILFSLALGCDWSPGWGDPCSPNNPAQVDPDVVQDCQACGQSPCPSETGDETGESDGDTSLLCGDSVQEITTEPNPNALICYDFPAGGIDNLVSSHWGAYGHLVHEFDCPFLSAPVPCERSWISPWETDQECTMCNLRHYNDTGYEPIQPYGGEFPWRMCHNPQIGAKYQPALTLNPIDETGVLPNWTADLQCTSSGAPPVEYPAIHDCTPVHMASSGLGGRLEYGQWTCQCDSDADCAIGSVCEAGYIFQNGLPKPTLCTWDDGSGSANGVAPEGPAAYGLAAWADGIDVYKDNVVITPAMLLAVAPREGRPFAFYNDDQRVDARGTITRCGPDSLCAHLGLRVGDRLSLERFSTGTLIAGGETYVTVTPKIGRVRTLTVSLD